MIFRRRFASRASRRAEKIHAQVVVVYVCVCVCVFLLEGMNPNEIFYGPVDLLIVPQVLSLLTTHFFIFQGDPLGSALLRLTSLLPVFSSSPEGDSPPLPPPLAFTQLLLAIKRRNYNKFSMASQGNFQLWSLACSRHKASLQSVFSSFYDKVTNHGCV